MNYLDIYEFWRTDDFFDAATREELNGLDPERDGREIEDRFYKDLEFGTGGMRGIMGAGTNRINRYTVGKATTGLGNYLLEEYGHDACTERGVAVAYDTRNHSREYAKVTADVLSAQGIRVRFFEAPAPTPQLSFAVRQLHCVAGVVITASHNPKEDNGYKVYDEYGCQLTPHQAKQVIKYVNAVNDYRQIPFDTDRDRTELVNVTDDFVAAALCQSINRDVESKGDLHIIYTPLYGTGRIPVTKALQEDGFMKVSLVSQQAEADGDFPTVVTPNPEDRRALALGIEQAEAEGADIVLGTDPDCDRVGVAVRTDQGFQLLTGNQTGALLADYVLNGRDFSTVHKPAVIKTIVTSDLGAEIARKKGLTVFSTLTGFKYVGEKMTQFEQARNEGCEERAYTFVLGYEESYGYLVGTHARDKDAVVSCLLICEMAAACKKRGKTLIDRLDEIYQEYGYYRDAQDSFTLKGKDGAERIVSMMTSLRKNVSPFAETEKIIDYSMPVEEEEGFGMLPTSNVLKYILKDGSWIAVRPSGTEPKIKIYYSIRDKDASRAEKKLQELRSTIQATLGLK